MIPPIPNAIAHIITALTLLLRAAAADTLSGHVVGVTDGDTLTLLDTRFQQHKIRLVGIDAPESEQPFGARAKQHLGSLVFGRAVTVDYNAQDHYGRTLGKVLINGKDINLAQIQAGLAWHYKAYQSDQSRADREQYAAGEVNARRAHRGLWADRGPIPPWDWRRGVRETFLRHSSPTASTCTVRTSCGQMNSCTEVRQYVDRCGATGLDGDGDGIACESLC
jgi:endonuclease YncB( thermonuclease family)